jgi:hypothetical protein
VLISKNPEDVKMENPQVTDFELGWLAGIWDGEGSIGVSAQTRKGMRTAYRPFVSIGNSDPCIILRIVEDLDIIGCKYFIGMRSESPAPHFGNKPMYQIMLCRFSEIAILLKKLMPHLTGIKKAKASLMLTFVIKRIQKINTCGNSKRHYTDDEIADAERIRNLRDFTQSSEVQKATEKIKSVLRGNPGESGRND